MIEYLCDFKFLLIVIGIYLLYKLGTVNYNLHLKLGHKGPPPLPFIGNYFDLFRYGFHEFDKMCLEKYGKIYPFYFGNVKIAMVTDEELLKQILIKEAKYFIDRLVIGIQNKHMQKMLTILEGKDWERVRNLVTPIFTSGKLRKMSPLIRDGMELLEKRLSDQPPDKPVDFKEFFGAFSMDVIARTMFGMHIDSQTNPNNLFILQAKKLFNISFFNPVFAIFYIFPQCTKVMKAILPSWDAFGKDTLNFFISNLTKSFEERQKSTEEYNDFLTLMIKAHQDIDETDSVQVQNLDSKSLTYQEIIAQSLVFLLSGYGTISTTLTYAIYFLAKNSQTQDEVYNEILETINEGEEITYEAVMNMTLLDAVINETLRICPPAIRLERKCTENIKLVTSDKQEILAKKGDIFAVPIYAMQMDSSIWPNPHIFDIHRFDPENKKNHSPYSFMPFGMGPRSCVGMRFALFEMKWAIVAILMKFRIVPCAETLEEIKFGKARMSSPVKPILLSIVKR